MKPATLHALITLCVTAAIITLVVVLFQQCEHQRERRAACLSAGKSAIECKALFPDGTGQ